MAFQVCTNAAVRLVPTVTRRLWWSFGESQLSPTVLLESSYLFRVVGFVVKQNLAAEEQTRQSSPGTNGGDATAHRLGHCLGAMVYMPRR